MQIIAFISKRLSEKMIMSGTMETMNKEKYRKMKKNILLPFVWVGIACLLGSCDKEDYFGQDDYEISNGVLLCYRGTGGDVIISKKLGITAIGVEAFAFEKYVTSIEIPDGVTRIDSAAFLRCSNLMSMSMPESLTSIGNDAFYYCTALASVEIPASVTSIGDYAFGGCPNLKTVKVGWQTPPVQKMNSYGWFSLFYGNWIENATLIVPPGTKTLYANAELWSKFGHIVESN
jgi:hypothetical protein